MIDLDAILLRRADEQASAARLERDNRDPEDRGGRPKTQNRRCSVPGCFSVTRALGFCNRHYQAHKRDRAARKVA